jgi:hypothetical protein
MECALQCPRGCVLPRVEVHFDRLHAHIHEGCGVELVRGQGPRDAGDGRQLGGRQIAGARSQCAGQQSRYTAAKEGRVNVIMHLTTRPVPHGPVTGHRQEARRAKCALVPAATPTPICGCVIKDCIVAVVVVASSILVHCVHSATAAATTSSCTHPTSTVTRHTKLKQSLFSSHWRPNVLASSAERMAAHKSMVLSGTRDPVYAYLVPAEVGIPPWCVWGGGDPSEFLFTTLAHPACPGRCSRGRV